VRSKLVSLCIVVALGVIAIPCRADTVMYGGLGGHSNGDSSDDGALATVDQNTAAVTIVGHPAGVSRISGLAFDNTGLLWGATQGPGGFPPPPGPNSASDLIRLNPADGSLYTSTLITDATGAGISIADLAVQPGTDALYGIRNQNDQHNGWGKLYTIDKVTGVASLVGDTHDFFGSIAFAPNGTLYMLSADLDFNSDQIINQSLKVLDPTNASVLSSIPTAQFYGAFGIRPTDGALFAGNGDQETLFTIDPLTGGETVIGNTGRNFVGDLAFLATPVPEPSSLALLGLGLGLVPLGFRLRRRSA
jgi:hypothetical protein